MSKKDDVSPDGGVDPDVDEDFPDDATIARDLKRYGRPHERRASGWGLWAIVALALCVMILLVPNLVSRRQQRDEWTRLIQAGGGQVRYMATDRVCERAPRLAWTGTRQGSSGGPREPAPIGTRVEVVANVKGWALIERYGRPCWVPSWSLRRTEIDWRVVIRCGRECYARAPAGWYAEQRKAACTARVLSRLGCFVEDLIKGRDSST